MPIPQKMPVLKSAHYCGTVHGYSPYTLEALSTAIGLNFSNRVKWTFSVAQEELCPETGKPHLQVYVQLSHAVKPADFLKKMKDLITINGHWEPCNGSSESNVDYCSKEKSRKPGTTPQVRGEYKELAAKPGQGSREDLEEIRNAIHDGATLEALEDKFFNAFCRYQRFLTSYWANHQSRTITKQLTESTSGTILRPWQRELLTTLEQPPPDRIVQWWWEERGCCGKSFMARHLALHKSFLVLQPMKKGDLVYLLSKQLPGKRGVIFDLTRTSEAGSVTVVYEVLEMLCNQYLCSGKYDSTAFHTQPLHLVVFSNYAPDRSAMSADRWSVHHIANPA